MPVEFAAACRFGHSMLRQSREHNRVFGSTADMLNAVNEANPVG